MFRFIRSHKLDLSSVVQTIYRSRGTMYNIQKDRIYTNSCVCVCVLIIYNDHLILIGKRSDIPRTLSFIVVSICTENLSVCAALLLILFTRRTYLVSFSSNGIEHQVQLIVIANIFIRIVCLFSNGIVYMYLL